VAVVLVTGGAGFLGSAAARRLADAGHEVVSLDVLREEVHGPGPSPDPSHPSRLVVGDVTDAGAVRTLVDRLQPEVVLHLAAETSTARSMSHASTSAYTNVIGTARLLDALQDNRRLRHLVLASSRAVYGEGRWRSGNHYFFPGPRRREQLEAGRWDPDVPSLSPAVPAASSAGTTLPSPSSVYGATKLAQEHLCAAWAAGNDVALTVLRIHNAFGPGQTPRNPYTGVLATFARRALAGEAIKVFEDGGIVRDFVYVDDVVDALAAAVQQPPGSTRTLDIGSSEAYSLLAVAHLLARRCGAPQPVVTGGFRPGDVRAAICDITQATIELGYVPRWSLERGVPRLLEWVETQLGDVPANSGKEPSCK